ncbi:hypothetical protein, partial [Actinotignum schaalii]|uniref:hypothetical protein n=1 Tax=Actinotignum schaalii TaxID=59505 RepID=UPI00254AE38C
PKKQNQNQIGTTATITNTQEAERCETRISQPSRNSKYSNLAQYQVSGNIACCIKRIDPHYAMHSRGQAVCP